MATKGYVYVGYDASGWGFKIGKSTNPKRRETEIKHMNPSFQILACAEVPDQHKQEELLHKRFEAKRLIGEWFDLTCDEVSELISGKMTADEIAELVRRD